MSSELLAPARALPASKDKLKVDYDRGIMKRLHPTGVEVYMYMDTPGVYLNAFGTPVADEMADQAGFPVGQFAKDKLKKERMAAALSFIEAELSDGPKVGEPIDERDGFKLVAVALDGFRVLDPDGNSLTPVPLPQKAAQALFNQLAPGPAPKPLVGAAKAAAEKKAAKEAETFKVA